MGSVVLDARRNSNSPFFDHTPVERSPYRSAAHDSSHSGCRFPEAPHASHRQQSQHQHSSPRPPYSIEHPVMSQRASSGGSSSTSATIGHSAASSRPTSVVNTRSAPPTEPALHASNIPLSPQSDSHNAIGATLRPAHSSRRRVKVRDLQHIQSFATEDMGAFSQLRNRSRSRSRGAGYDDEGTQYEISEMKVEHIIEMVAGLLTKITSTNDQQHEHLHRQPPSIDHASGMSAQTSSVLAFHGKNIPSITILSYLSRINKYCPTSYEVFLSLLVYFDRMTERVNAGPIQGLRQMSERNLARHNQPQHRSGSASSSSSSSLSSDKMEDIINHGGGPDQNTQTATPPASGSMEKATEQKIPGTPYSKPRGIESPSIPMEPRSPDLYNLSHFFVVDSFNIHRLVIAGVTCASKFFSDIFYTNSRYAKVGGLPLPELNHLELQFLLLNDFRLSIPVEEIEAYGTMLVEFYAREVVAQQRAADEAVQMRSSSESSADSAMTVQAAG